MKLCTLTETFDPTTPIGKLLISTLASIAEFEREIIRERTQEGYRAAIAKGEKICHRPKKDIPKKKVLECVEKGLSAGAIAKLFETSPNTIKNRLNEWGYVFDGEKWVF